MDSDDEALSWDGDIRDPTYVDGDRRPQPQSPRGRSLPGALPQQSSNDSNSNSDNDDSNSNSNSNSDDNGSPAPIGSGLLVAYGAVAAVYVLFTIGWIITSVRSGIALPNPFFDVMYRIGRVLAIAAPALWFGTAFLLTRNYRPRRMVAARLVALLVGMLLVAPWPFIVGGGS